MLEYEEEQLHDDLIRAGVIAPVEPDGPDEQTWHDYDLASLAENWLGDPKDPRELDSARRADWRARATTERSWSLRERGPYQRCYWLLDEGRRAIGTLALATDTLGSTRVGLSSFYLLPSYRGQGLGRRVMKSIMDAARKRERGIRLETSWCWGGAVEFYLKLGFWVMMWKHDLTLCWGPEVPSPHFDAADDEVRLSVSIGGASVRLGEARRRGDQLEWALRPEDEDLEPKIGEAGRLASSTLALAIARRGFPLVRSKEEWETCCYYDNGPPEALAYKITIWEADARRRGWKVNAPRIPGLYYPTWDEFQARWDAARKEIDARRAARARSDKT